MIYFALQSVFFGLVDFVLSDGWFWDILLLTFCLPGATSFNLNVSFVYLKDDCDDLPEAFLDHLESMRR